MKDVIALNLVVVTGRDKTLSKIAERFYWCGMVDDVKEFCKTCDKCQRANSDAILYAYVVYICSLYVENFDKSSAELHSIPVKWEVWHTIGVDLCIL